MKYLSTYVMAYHSRWTRTFWVGRKIIVDSAKFRSFVEYNIFLNDKRRFVSIIIFCAVRIKRILEITFYCYIRIINQAIWSAWFRIKKHYCSLYYCKNHTDVDSKTVCVNNFRTALVL